MMEEKSFKVAVVILNWNGAKMLRQFLPSVVRYSYADDVEICMADNGSTDDSIRLVEDEFPDVRVIDLKENYGFAEGYNRALSQVNARYAVLLNSDVEVTEGWLKPLTEYMDAHPEVAACQPKILSWHNREKFEYAGAAGGFIDRYGYPFCRGRILSSVETDNGQYNDACRVFWATGASLFIRLDDYREAGGLDASFFAHMEEIDLCWRLGSRGRGLACVPKSVVYHVGGATLSKENPRKTYLNFRNSLLMLYKNLPADELGSVMRVRCLLDWVAMFSFIAKADFGNAKAVWQARRDFRRLRPDYTSAREENLSKSTTPNPQGRFRFSLIVSYYLKGCREFGKMKL
jgi:GT2 family glycosyltransferase